MPERAPLLVEVLTEELPPQLVFRLAADFRRNLAERLAQEGFAPPGVSPGPELVTSRRLAALIDDVAAVSPPRENLRRGPRVAAALGADGEPTPALLGFIRSCGAGGVADLERVSDKGGERFAFRETVPGADLDDALAGIVDHVLRRLSAPRLMRWGASDARFVRPVRGVAMIHGDRAVPGEIFGVAAAPSTQGHRLAAPGVVKLASAAGYAETLRAGGAVVVDPAERRRVIAAGLASAAGANAAPAAESDLAENAAASAESPNVIRCAIDAGIFAELAALPEECVVACMEKHQRVFPVREGGRLSPLFLAVADNAPTDPSAMIRGYERVLDARLRDLMFFFQEDTKVGLDRRLAQLGSIVYHKTLGSQADRASRIEAATAALASLCGAESGDAELALRAAKVCKADLPTLLVGEYPELQGVAAAAYFGDAQTAPVLREQNGDSAGGAAFLLCLANHLERLLGMFAAAGVPTGSGDPHALRRSAQHVARMLSAGPEHTPARPRLQPAVAAVAATFTPHPSAEIVDQVCAFVVERLLVRLKEELPASAVNAAVAAEPTPLLSEIAPLARALSSFGMTEAGTELAEADKRIKNILRKSTNNDSAAVEPSEALLRAPEERALHRAAGEAAAQVTRHLAERRYESALSELASLAAPLASFFDEVLVNVEDSALRHNRLALLRGLRDRFAGVGDLSQLLSVTQNERRKG